MLSFEDRQMMHEDACNPAPEPQGEISRGSVVLRGNIICLVQRVRGDIIYAVAEDGREISFPREEATVIAEDELLRILEARVAASEKPDSEQPAKEEEPMNAAECAEKANTGKEEKAVMEKPQMDNPEARPMVEEKPLPPLVDGWYQLEKYSLEIAPGLKLTGLQICKAKYESRLKAFANVKLNGVLTIYGFKIVSSGKTASLIPPQRKGTKTYLGIVTFESNALKKLEKIVLRLATRTEVI